MVSLGRSLAFCSVYTRSSSSFIVARRPFILSSGLATFATASRAESTTVCDMAASTSVSTGYLNAKDAAALDVELMSTPGFSLEQLMELAGLSVAEAIYQVVPPSSDTDSKKKKIVIVCGPGNNGGDGLVAARHLVMFGYDCVVVYPKQSQKQPFLNLVQQCQDVGVPVLDTMPDNLLEQGEYSAVVDSMFGFSFHGTKLREPFGKLMSQLMEAQDKLKIPAISVDIPSGWNVDGGDEANTGFKPDVLISLTAPKLAAKTFTGRHFIGGRFVPPKLSDKYNIQMPPYPGVSQVMEVSNLSES